MEHAKAQTSTVPHYPDVRRLLANGLLPRMPRTLRTFLGDPLYRGSLNLFLSTGILTVLGLAFWTFATHNYPVSTVGVFSAITAGVGLLATLATLGFQNTITRHIAAAEDPRALATAALAVIASVGAVLCLFTILVLGPHLPPEFELRQRGSMALLLTALVVVSAVGTVLNFGLIATRATRALLIANTAGSIVKLAAIAALTAFRSSGILLAFSIGLFVATGGAGVALFRQLRGPG